MQMGPGHQIAAACAIFAITTASLTYPTRAMGRRRLGG